MSTTDACSSRAVRPFLNSAAVSALELIRPHVKNIEIQTIYSDGVMQEIYVYVAVPVIPEDLDWILDNLIGGVPRFLDHFRGEIAFHSSVHEYYFIEYVTR